MSTLTISLLQSTPFNTSKKARAYDPELDDITSLLTDICDALSESGGVRFHVGGFGQDPWPVDVWADLLVVIKQVPSVINAVRRGSATLLGFYEQGIQRVLAITPSGAVDVVVECQSMTSWHPQPSTIIMKSHELLALLGNFLKEFIECAGQCCPELVEHAWFHAWVHEAQ